MTHTARSICQAWLDAVNAHDLEAIAALYSDDSVLLPTFSPHIIKTDEARRAYFTKLASQQGLSVELHEKTFHSHDCGKECIASGIYCFRMEMDGEKLSFESRFTFVLDLTHSKPILHHHSSQIPRNLG